MGGVRLKKISSRIIMFGVCSSLAITLILGFISSISMVKGQRSYLADFEKKSKSDYDQMIKAQVESVTSMLEKYLDVAQKQGKSVEEVKKSAEEIVRAMKYGENGRFWVDTVDGTNVVLSGSGSEGKNRLDLQDSNGKYYIKEIIENSQKGGELLQNITSLRKRECSFACKSYSMEFKLLDGLSVRAII